MAALHDFIDTEKTYQLVVERFNSDSLPQNNVVNKAIDMNPELIELILDLYNNEEDFPFEKMKKFE